MYRVWFKSTSRISLACLILGVGIFLLNRQVTLADLRLDTASRPSDNTAVPHNQSAPADVQIALEIAASGFNQPVQATHAGDGSGRLFVVEQRGQIKIIKNGAVLATPFLDIRHLVRSPEDGGGGEQGLLGLAFHPNYQSNGYFYLNYSDNNGDTVIARYTVSGNPDLANSGSAVTLLGVDQPYSNHNGGQLLFSPIDGYLYIGLGDGGSGGDPHNHGQNINTLLGSMLRIDVDSGSPYAIPPDNPYANSAGADEIWAIGLRNPWRFSFDRTTGDLYIGDVGQNAWEEVSYQATNTSGGVNFGWRCREGTHTFNTDPPCNNSALLATLTDPITEYNHNEGNAVTGGFVYRGPRYANLVGRYFFADYGQGKIWSIYQTGSGSWSDKELELDTSFLISAFGEDETGELYVVGYNNGTIYHLVDANGPSPNLSSSAKSVSTPHADPSETITYTIQLRNTGSLSSEIAQLIDTLPAGLSYVPGSLTASHGTVDASQATQLLWSGPLNTELITITYQAVPVNVRGSLVNKAQLTSPSLGTLNLSAAVYVPRPVLTTTPIDFFLPGTQPGQLNDNIPDPNGCNFCHTAPIFDRWRGSMMSQAGRDPLMWAALAVANSDAPGAGEYCLRCHTPKGWLEGRSQPADGNTLHADDIEAGVACEICHRLVDPIPSTSDEAVSLDSTIRTGLTSTPPPTNPGSGMLIIDPEDNRRGPFAFEPDPPHPRLTLRTDFLGQSANAITESRLCGTCHNVDNPALSWNENPPNSAPAQFWPNETNLAAPSFEQGQLFPIETTFDEWANSEYATTGVFAPQLAGSKPDGVVRSCQDCHMRRTTGKAAEDNYNPVIRNCATTSCLPEHDLVGGNTWVPQILQTKRWRLNSQAEAVYLNTTTLRARQMLQQAATLTVTLTGNGGDKIAAVRVINQTGHKLPTGYPEGRRMWLNLKAYDDNNSLIYESGAYDPATGILTEDSAIKIYEAKQGLTPELAAMLGLPAGESFHFVLNNTVIKDNRIPPRGYNQATFDQPGLRPVGVTYLDGQYWDDTIYTLPATTARVVATLYYQTASKEYIDFLRTNGGLDGVTLGMLWDSSKSPPEIMASATFPIPPVFLPLIFK